jgi:hypothetical protein
MEDFNWTGFIFWSLIGWLSLKILQKYLEARNEILKEEIDQLEKKLKERFIHVSVEKHGDIFYLYEKDSGQFIAQGKTMEELKSHCDQRFRRSVIIGNTDELKSAGLI